MSLVLTQFDPATDVEALVRFLDDNEFPFHRRPTMSAEQARGHVNGGRFWYDDSTGFWIDADETRVGIAVVDDIEDIASGGSPVFDLRLAGTARGHGLGVPVLRALTDLVFARWPELTRFEGHTREDNLAMRATFRRAGWVKEAFHREAWPVEGAAPRGSVTYAVLRRDWEAGTTTPVNWDEL